MATLTLRNIPEAVMARVRGMAAADRRSVNNELLVLIERGLADEPPHRQESLTPDTAAQVALWRKLCGTWQDVRSTEEIVADIQAHRSLGREVDL